MSYRLEIGFALLLGLALAIAVWAASREPARSDFDFRSSTFNSGPNGSRGLHEVLRELGRPSERRRTSLENLAAERGRRPALLVLLSPIHPLEEDEIEQVVRYVRGGGAVLATGGGGGVARCAGWRTQAVGQSDSMAVKSSDSALRLPYARRVLTPRTSVSAEPAREGLSKEDIEAQRLGICNTLVPFAVDTIIAALNNRPVILRLRFRGGGTITLAADRGWFTNRAWRDTDVSIIGLPLLTPNAASGRVVWDEYHQGFGDDDGSSLIGSTWAWLRGSPIGWAILQLIAVALVWLATTAVRFGPPRSVVERRRRSPLEHLEALGAGLESAADADTAVHRLVLGLRRRLSRTGQPATEDVVPWLQGLELAMRRPQGRAAVRRLQHVLSSRDNGDAAGRVLQAAQAVEDVWEELHPPDQPHRPPSTRSAS